MDKVSRLQGEKMDLRIDKRAMDMDMDVAWCLTCSKRTRDPRSPYCSDECRDQDLQPSTSALFGNASPSITAHVPSRLQSPAKPTRTPRSTTSRTRSPSIGAVLARRLSRPPLTTLPSPTQQPLDASPIDKSQATLRPRDRRAFSFPAPPPAPRAYGRPSQAMLPPFIRKPNPVSGGTNSPSVASAKPSKEHGKLGVKSPTKSRTTGGNTPQAPESVFGSTSESEPDHDVLGPTISPFPSADISTDPTSLPLSRVTTTRTSQLDAKVGREITREDTQDTLRLPRHDATSLAQRKSSQSPVAALVASSASSRSREDIISWAQKVSERPIPSSESEDEEDRGRSRTRRSPRPKSALKKLPSHNEGEEEETDARAGTTPKSRSSIGSALAGLSIGGFGVGPIVKALSTITTPAPVVPAAPMARRLSVAAHGALGLQAVPSPAEVSKVEVVTTSTTTSVAPTPSRTIHRPPPSSSACPTDSDAPPHFGGATPTLSTISVSEVMDPSMSDAHDHVEVVTDLDEAMSTASYARRTPSSSSRGIKTAQAAPKPTRKAPLPLRPVVSTANAIWNLSTYIRSIAPFSISSAIAPYGPFSPSAEVAPLPAKPQQPAARPKTSAVAVEPVSASRVASPQTADSSLVQMVRSLPMDIALPLNAGAKQANQERMIEREANRWLGRSGSRRRTRSRRSRSRSRERSASRSRSRSRKVSRSREMSLDMSEDERATGKRYTSYDADESGAEDEPRRGRSRRRV